VSTIAALKLYFGTILTINTMEEICLKIYVLLQMHLQDDRPTAKHLTYKNSQRLVTATWSFGLQFQLQPNTMWHLAKPTFPPSVFPQYIQAVNHATSWMCIAHYNSMSTNKCSTVELSCSYQASAGHYVTLLLLYTVAVTHATLLNPSTTVPYGCHKDDNHNRVW